MAVTVEPVSSLKDIRLYQGLNLGPIDQHVSVLTSQATGAPWAECLCIVVVLLFYIHSKHLRSCQDGQLT